MAAKLFGNQGKFQPFGYTGYRKDMVAGTYHAQAREYDAGAGRFTGEDIIKGYAAYPETLNAYGYCWGNPWKYVDRDGREPEFVLSNDYKMISYDENGIPAPKKKEQYFISGDDYEVVSHDENGIPIIKKKDAGNGQTEIDNVEILDKTYDGAVDALSIMNEVNNEVMPKWIKNDPRPNNIGAGTWNKKIAKELAAHGKFYSKANKVLEKAGYLGVAIDGGISVYNNVQEGTSLPRTISDAVIDTINSFIIFTVSGAVGAELGAAIGAVAGSFAGPVGTAIGAIAGSGLGTCVLSIFIAGILNYYINNKEIYNGKSISENVKESVWSDLTRIADWWNSIYDACFD